MSADAFVRLARRQVERAFEGLPDDVTELPLIGGAPFCHLARPEQKQVVVAALVATRWAETELPPWMLPLLLKPEDCVAMFQRSASG